MAKKKLIYSFQVAFQGLISIAKKERNLKIHLSIFSLVCLAGIYFSITKFEWLTILMISALVISLEIVNTAIEKLCDFCEPNHNEKIKIIKDTAAAAILVAAAIAICIGLIVFVPHIFW